MKIGELARLAGCDVETVRFYEREGLLEMPERDGSGYRNYHGAHLARLHFIRHCRALDLPLREIRQLLDYSAKPDISCPRVNTLVDDHIALVRQRVRALKSLEKQLVALRKTCKGDASGPCVILQTFTNSAEEQTCACHPRTTVEA